MVENNQEAWYEAIKKAVEDSQLRQSLLAKARERALESYQMDKAGDAWQKIIQGLNIERVEVQELLRPDSIRPVFIERLKFFFRQLLRPQIYKNAIKVFFEEGPKGLIWRLRRL